MKAEVKAFLFLAIVVLILSIITLAAFFKAVEDENKENPRACPADARICPDGTTTARVPPDCEFGKCPNE